MRFFYERVSTQHQSLGRQEEMMKNLQIDQVFADKASGKTMERPQLQRLLETVRSGDTVVVESYSRLSRSTKDLLSIIEKLQDKNVFFESLKEQIDTSTATGKLFLTIIAGISEFEREIMLERQREGIEVAKKNHKYKGRQPIKYDAALFVSLYDQWEKGNITQKMMCKMLHMSRGTLYKHIAEYKQSSRVYGEAES